MSCRARNISLLRPCRPGHGLQNQGTDVSSGGYKLPLTGSEFIISDPLVRKVGAKYTGDVIAEIDLILCAEALKGPEVRVLH
jgi:hypothetical protein